MTVAHCAELGGGVTLAPLETESDTQQINRYLLKKVDELELSVRRPTA
jgi:DNA-directed RNA polymerase subunit alpha